MHRAFATRILLLILASFLQPKVGIAKGDRFSQLSLVLSSPRQYEWDFDRKHNALILYVKQTTADEFKNVDEYDESTIKRVVVRDLGGQGTQIKFYLRDRDLRATIAHFQEPFRINIDVYDVNFKEKVDPETGLPLVPAHSPMAVESENSSPYIMGASSSDSWSEAQTQDHDQPIQMIPKTKHQFVSPEQSSLTGADQSEVAGIKSGLGEAWSQYPIYVYRLHTALHLADETQQQWMQTNSKNAQSSPESMAEFAGKLYDFGHELKALEGYRQVLKEKPSIFQRAPLHMWRLAEANLGTGNINLADGYYSQFISLFPQSKLHTVAQIRRLDIAAIRAIKNQNNAVFAGLVSQLDQIPNNADADFQGLKAIRRAYWSNVESNFSDRIIPEISAKEYNPLESSLEGLESFKTQFLARTLLLNNMTHANHPWKESTGTFAADYFRRYKDYGNTHYADIIKERLKNKLESTVAKDAQAQNYDKVVALFEGLPKSLQSIRKTPIVAWFIAESYRKMGQADKAVELYDAAAEGADSALNRFKASVWQGVLASRIRKSAAAGKRRELDQLSASADKRMAMTWKEMDAPTRKQAVAVLRDPLEAAVMEENTLRAPLTAMLDSWEATMAPQTTPNSAVFSADNNAHAIKTLSVMARKFKSYGESENRQKTINLIKMLRPSQLGDDSKAKSLWTQEIVAIAEDMRLENNLLEAGRLYVLAGTESENFENRAESLYKGGLLLYRSGRRKEAVEALQRASEDGDNQFYANLAKERLNRLSN